MVSIINSSKIVPFKLYKVLCLYVVKYKIPFHVDKQIYILNKNKHFWL